MTDRQYVHPFREKGYSSLAEVLIAAYNQAALGKGKDRHAGDQPFDEQPMQQISRLLGNGDGMAFQAIKKIREARNLRTREAQIRELLGAIVYVAGMVIQIQDQSFQDAKNQFKNSGD